MNEQPGHQSLRLENFTAFKNLSLDFVPGINAFVGENGTGKTHVLKALYAVQLTGPRRSKPLTLTLGDLFQTKNPAELIRMEALPNTYAQLRGNYEKQEWTCSIHQQHAESGWSATEGPLPKVERPVFIPTIDMMGHTKGFLAASNEVMLDFDLTYTDIVALLGLERKNSDMRPVVLDGLAQALGGTLEYDEGNSRFYLVNALGRLPMPLVGEGLRKIATLVRLAQNGWLVPGTTLFWDEPEVNLNPKLMDEVVVAIFALSRAGIQVFLATHSYVILKELNLQAKHTDSVRYFAFARGDDGTTVNTTDDFALLDPNPILDQYNSLYDRELTRATGRNRKGERVR